MSPAPALRHTPLNLIQRLHMHTKDNQVGFADRFIFDQMNAPEFHGEMIWERIRELSIHCQVGEIMVDGCFMLAAWNPNRFTKHEVENALNRHYHGEIPSKERTNFNRAYRRIVPREKRWTNSWFDIENGLFWTWERCNISDIRKNFARTAAEWVRGNEIPQALVYDTSLVGPLRQQLIDAGVIRPVGK